MRICRPEDFHGFEPKYLQDRPKFPMILLFPLFNLFTELLLLKKTTVSHFTFKPLWFRWKNCIFQNTIDSLHQFQEMKFSLAALFITGNSSTSEPWTITMQPVIFFTELTIVYTGFKLYTFITNCTHGNDKECCSFLYALAIYIF